MSTHTALLVIDVQVGLIDGPEPSYQRDEVLANIAGLLTKARATATPVIFVQHTGDPDSPLEIGAPDWQVHPTVAPRPDETIIRKRASDSFYETPLQDLLQERQIQHLVITGCRTEMCVDTTSRIAISRGYDVTLVKDAHSTVDSEVLTSAQIVAHHNYTLDDFGTDEHVIVARAASEVEF